MDETRLKQVVAYNITECRKKLGLTQLELAQRLNYSDKTISKWERAEAIPDVFVLTQLAAVFGVNVDMLISENGSKRFRAKRLRQLLTRRFMIPFISVLCIFFAATVIFSAFYLADVNVVRKWLVYIYAVLASSVVLTAFSLVWFKSTRIRIICTSLFNWSLALTLFLLVGFDKSYLFFIISGALQLVIIFWFLLKHARK